MLDPIWDLFHRFELAIIGAIGALAALRFHPDAKERAAALSFLACGASIAFFTTGLISEYFGIKPAHAGAVGFLLGAFGGSLLSAVTKAINAADLWAIIKGKLGSNDKEGGQ